MQSKLLIQFVGLLFLNRGAFLANFLQLTQQLGLRFELLILFELKIKVPCLHFGALGAARHPDGAAVRTGQLEAVSHSERLLRQNHVHQLDLWL